MDSILEKKITLTGADILYIMIVVYFIHRILDELGGIHAVIDDIVKGI